jgi:predicted DNA-binding transcriptional regulator AlpA
MSLITQAFIVERYGLRLKIEQLAEILGITKGALYNQISAGTCPVKTYMDGGKRWADYRDVAAHLDECQKVAA